MINDERIPRDIVVIGASAGGVLPLIDLLAGLNSDLPAVIGVVLHRSPYFETRLPLVLGRKTALHVMEPDDGQTLIMGAVYVAPRDQHMLFVNGVVRLSRGPKEHRTRPAVDPLFRSAAAAYGPRVVGVLLSGMGADGVPGLVDIKKAGGISLVQDPVEARFGSMPHAAITKDDVDAILPIAEMAPKIAVLARGGPLSAGSVVSSGQRDSAPR